MSFLVIFMVKHEMKKILKLIKKPCTNKSVMQNQDFFSGNSLQLEALGFDDRADVFKILFSLFQSQVFPQAFPF